MMLGVPGREQRRSLRLGETIEVRMAEIRARIDAEHIQLDRIGKYLTLMERHLMNHDIHRLHGELAWHQELIEALPAIIDDEKSRKALRP